LFKEQDFAYEELIPLPIKPENLLSEFNLNSPIIHFKPQKKAFSRSFTVKLDLHIYIATNDKEKAPFPVTIRGSIASGYYAIASHVNFTHFQAR